MLERLSPQRPLRRTAVALTTLAFVFFGLETNAQQILPDQNPPVASKGAADGVAPDPRARLDETNVDESALRYYASNSQTERRDAELQRLRRLYPNWKPPADIYDKISGSGVDEDDLWKLFAADKLEQLRTAFDERRARQPGWEPSLDLRAKLSAKIFRDQILKLAKEDKFAEIVQLAKASRPALKQIDVDVLWTLAEASAKSLQSDEALAIYKSILSSNADAAQRLTTVQKAIGELPMAQMDQLLALARQDASGKSELAPIRVDIVRARIAAFLHDERKNELSEDDLGDFGVYARKAQDSNQSALLGWYYLKLKHYQQALNWFKFSIDHGGDAIVAQGLAHTLDLLGMRREAEEVAYAWRKPLINNALLFIDILETQLTAPIPPYIEPERLARYGEVTLAIGSGEGAQALGWYAYNSCQFDVSRQWFERAVAWFPKDQTVFGYGLALNRLKKPKEVAELVNRYDGLFPRTLTLLFQDGLNHPPLPCEQAKGARAAVAPAGALPTNVYGDHSYAQQTAARYGAAAKLDVDAAATHSFQQEARQDPIATRQNNWGRVAGPGEEFRPERPKTAMPRISKSEFPISVNPENPLRYSPSGRPPIVNAAVGAVPPSAAGGFAREPAAKAFPLVARRVQGAGPMPYERYGFALLPSYNGVTAPSSSAGAEQIAPAGTAWSLERQNAPSSRSAAEPPDQPVPLRSIPLKNG